ncbi:hypothetical protein GX48_07142 [Paracoccidioides brasiliensis]|nr:hypothetical protein GX48_07142 [Paracoccidioides brasiliensis]
MAVNGIRKSNEMSLATRSRITHGGRSGRSKYAMFDALEADIVIFQEAKVQKKDLQDDMVLVNGWNWYSGVVIYTRNSKCCPIRAEEGITGILCPPASSSTSPFPALTSFRDMPEEQQIGGYPTPEQLALSNIDAATLDSEGRCVILEFPAFVLLGVYCPANRDEMRDGFRKAFVNAVDARVRNLVGMGKRVILTGDLNISGSEIDSARALEEIRKGTTTNSEFVSAPVRRIFNQLVSGGKVIGDRDQGRETPVLVDLCREYHPDRRGMYTCWEQRVNARPGNYGSRIDYVLCSLIMRDWFCASNIQEGLMGSDHCPVYADIKDKVSLDDMEVHILDILNPDGMFVNGERKKEYSSADVLPLSGRLIPEFCQRRSIRDMLFRQSSKGASQGDVNSAGVTNPPVPQKDTLGTNISGPASPSTSTTPKRSQQGDDGTTSRSKRLKRSQSSAIATARTKGQKSLKGFFGLKGSGSTADDQTDSPKVSDPVAVGNEQQEAAKSPLDITYSCPPGDGCGPEDDETQGQQQEAAEPLANGGDSNDDCIVHDPIANKESWSRIFTKKPAPRCSGHHEPCISLVTKKAGINCGRSFWICARPLGPSGVKKTGDQWRCDTFIWSSDWNGPK